MEHSKRKSGRYLSTFFFLWVTIIIPLYYERAYFNILQAKGHIYIAGAVIVILYLVFSLFILKNKDLLTYVLKKKWDITSYSIVVFGVLATISSLFSGDFLVSFWGIQGWCVGGFAFLSFSIIYIVLASYLELGQNMWLPVIAVNSVIFIIGIFHSAGIDVLSLHKNMVPNQVFKYISTIGNLNWYVGYLCLLVPMIGVFYISCSDRNSILIYLVFLSLACINIVLCGSDGIYLGFGFCAFFALPYIFQNEIRIRRFCILLILYGCSLLLIDTCPIFKEKAESIQGISGAMLNRKVEVMLLICAFAGIVLSIGKLGTFLVSKKHIVIVALEIILASLAIYFIFDMVSNFGEHWGTNRGKTWVYSFEMFRKFSFKNKLIGIGPEMLAKPYQELSQWFGRTILVSHSEPLQILLTMGSAGLVCWSILWGSVFVNYRKKRMWETERIAFFLPLVAYFGQSFVNSPQITNTAMLCIMFACWHVFGQMSSSTHP